MQKILNLARLQDEVSGQRLACVPTEGDKSCCDRHRENLDVQHLHLVRVVIIIILRMIMVMT